MIILDEEDGAGFGGTEGRHAQYSSALHPLELTEDEAQLLRLLAEGYSDKDIRHRLDKPGLDVNRVALHLCGKLAAKSKAELIQRAKEMGLLGSGTQC